MMCSVDGATQIYAVLGNPIGHTLSPAMYNAAFRKLQMNSIYVAFRVGKNRLEEAVRGIKALGIRGGNVTIPLKEAIIPYLDGLTEEARLIGAVNTFYWAEGKESGAGLWGDNTDGAGFLAAIRKVNPQILRERSAVMFGAGGAARAVAVALALAGMKELTILNRQRAKAVALAERLEKLGMKVNVRFWPTEAPKDEEGQRAASAANGSKQGEQAADLRELFQRSGLVVNTTPLGMAPQAEGCPPLDEAWLHPQQLVVDLIYRPRETLFLRKAREAGCQTLNGLSMLLAQGALSFQRWADTDAPVEVMAKELERWV